MSKLAKSLLVGAVMAASSLSAQAATALTFTNGESTFGNIFSSPQKFEDVFTFTIGGISDVAGLVTSLKAITPTSSKGLNLTNFWINGNGGGKIEGDKVFNKGVSVWTVDTSNLVAGTYKLHIKGEVTGTNGGSYSGLLSVSPVPEPATWGMMLGGLGLVGFMMRRRKTEDAENMGAMTAA